MEYLEEEEWTRRYVLVIERAWIGFSYRRLPLYMRMEAVQEQEKSQSRLQSICRTPV